MMVLTMIFGIYGCENEKGTLLKNPTITGTADIVYVIGDEKPNYLDGVEAKSYLGESLLVITIDDAAVDYENEGNYDVYYRVSDDAENTVSVKININVKKRPVIDTTAPYFEGVQSINYSIGQDIPNYQATIKAFDNVDGEITNKIIYDEGMLNYEVPSLYSIRATVSDKAGNEQSVVFVIHVKHNQKPVISGYNRIYYYIGEQNPDYLKMIEVYDLEDGDLIDSLEVNDSLVDLSTPGIYPLYYTVSDSFGYEAEQIVSVQVRKNDPNYQTANLNVYYINDTHGSILQNGSEMGLARIGNQVLDDYTKNPYETLFLSGGDILQGNVLSNYFYGSSMIDVFNHMNLDVFTIGNHEFDWGLDVVTEYFNPTSLEMKAQFPLLGANVFYKGTEVRPDHMDAYAVFHKGNLKIGVVGTIGQGLESSIASGKVADYEFADPVEWTKYYTEILRTEFDCDVVFAVIHENDAYFNETISSSYGAYQVDGIFNGHSHSDYVRMTINGKPLIQSSSNARKLGLVQYQINDQKEAIYVNAKNLSSSAANPLLNIEHPELKALIETYEERIEVLNKTILTSKKSYGRSDLTIFLAKIMRESSDADIGFHNSGGTRASLTSGQEISEGTTYQLFPFDNEIVKVKMLGSTIKRLLGNLSLEYSLKDGLSESDIISSEYYWVATNEYVFGYKEFQGYPEANIVHTGLYDRLEFVKELYRQQQSSTFFEIK